MIRESGQTLIEVLVALVVTAIIIVALMVVVLTSMKNSQFAQNQALATKYAQEAIDKVRSIRDRDGAVIFSGYVASSGCNTSSTFEDLWGCYLSDPSGINNTSPCTQKPSGGAVGCYLKIALDSGGLFLEESSSSTPSALNEDLGEGFSRQILLTDESSSYTNEKKMTILVKWSDVSGEHQSNLQTILTK